MHYAKNNGIGSGKTLPEGAVEITAEQYREAIQRQASGERITVIDGALTFYRGPVYREDGSRASEYTPGEPLILDAPPANLSKPQYVDGAWVEGEDPSVIEENKRSDLIAYTKTKRREVQEQGITWNGYPVQTDATSRQNIGDEVLAAQTGTRPDPDTFRMGDNTAASLSNADMIAMGSAVRNHYKAAYAVSWQVMADIAAGRITDRAGVDNANWPGSV